MHTRTFYVEVRDAAGKVLDEIETEVSFTLHSGFDVTRITVGSAPAWPLPETSLLDAIGKEALAQIDASKPWTGWKDTAIEMARRDERDMARERGLHVMEDA